MRATEQEDGSLLWTEEVMEGAVIYEPVEGLEDVYKLIPLNEDFLRKQS